MIKNDSFIKRLTTFARSSVTVVILISFLSGCTRQNATTGEEETSTAAKSALGGAIAGALAGAATGKKNAALYGALGGAAIGGGIGYYFDQQEAALRKELVDSGVQVKRVGEGELQLIMEKGIGFKSAGYNLTNSIYASLNGVAEVLNEYSESSLVVSGHTDSVGAANSNMTLSERRAESVRDYLIQKGVKSGRITTKGYGELRPISNNDSAIGRANNRRVEIAITAN